MTAVVTYLGDFYFLSLSGTDFFFYYFICRHNNNITQQLLLLLLRVSRLLLNCKLLKESGLRYYFFQSRKRVTFLVWFE